MRCLDKVGTFGSVLTAAACPGCFPLLASLGTAVGLGAMSAYEGQIFLATKILVALAIVGHILAYRSHRSLTLVILGVGGGVLFFVGMYLVGIEAMIYLGLLAMVAASVGDLVRQLRIRRQFRLRPLVSDLRQRAQ